MRFVEGSYREHRSATVGAFFLTKRLTILDTITCKLLLWDTAGQQQFQKLAVTYYQQAAAAIVCFDLSDGNLEGQMAGLTKWLTQIQQTLVNAEHRRRIVISIVGCKGDLPATPGLEEEAKNLAQQHGALYIKTSAKKDINVQKVFSRIAETVLQCQQDYLAGNGPPIPVTMGGATISHATLRSASSSAVSPNNALQQSDQNGVHSPLSMIRNNSLTVGSPTGPQSPQQFSANNSGIGAEAGTTALHTDLGDEKKEETMDMKTNDSSSPTSAFGQFMCQDGLLVCGSSGTTTDEAGVDGTEPTPEGVDGETEGCIIL